MPNSSSTAIDSAALDNGTVVTVPSAEESASEQDSTPTSTIQRRAFGDQLAYRIWTTRGARFNAHRRLRSHTVWSHWALACLAVYLTVLTWAMTMPVFRVSSEMQAKISVVVSALSLLMVVVSLMESGQNHAVRAERLHSSAVDLGGLGSRVDAARERAGDVVSPELEELARDFHGMIKSCQENHDEIDYELFRAKNRTDFGIGWFSARLTRHLFVPLRSYGIQLAAVFVPPVVGLWYLFS
ncbi:MAG TPA: SLATT domain-containing protein [Gemmatimonadales bacterium]